MNKEMSVESYLNKLKEILDGLKNVSTKNMIGSGESIKGIGHHIPNIPSTTNENIILKQKNLEYEQHIDQLQMSRTELQKTINLLETEILKHKTASKDLRNEIIDLKGTVRVYCRVKPCTKMNEIKYSDTEIELNGKSFTVDKVFSEYSNQKDIFEDMNVFIDNVLEGYNMCIFAYGQTGSGKTYTMEGKDIIEDRWEQNSIDSEENADLKEIVSYKKDGLIYNSLYKLSDSLKILNENGFNTYFTLKYIEIYNETIFDLFTGEKITIAHDKIGISLKNTTEIKSKNLEDIIKNMRKASEKRKVGETQSNRESSRSHAVFILDVNIENETEKRSASLCLIDLAGSERLNQSKAENERLKETQNINKSLAALGNVFNSIKKSESHIPFRDSKLTHLMEKYLSGKSRMAVIVNINPEFVNESICTLRFATKVSECSLGKVERTAKVIHK